MKIIVRETKRCRDIVKGLLDFARPMPARKTNVDFNSVIGQALQIVDNQLSCRRIIVQAELSTQLPPVKADASQLQEVFLNIIINAETEMRLARGRGNLLVKTETIDNTIQISCKDIPLSWLW